MKFKLYIMGLLVLVATNLAVAVGERTRPFRVQDNKFMVIYQNNTNHAYTYINNLKLDSPKQGFDKLGNWVSEGALAIGNQITFDGVFDRVDTNEGHWVKFKLVNSIGKEILFELVSRNDGGPVLYYGNNKINWTNWPKTPQNEYIIHIELRTESGNDIPVIINPYTGMIGAGNSPFGK